MSPGMSPVRGVQVAALAAAGASGAWMLYRRSREASRDRNCPKTRLCKRSGVIPPPPENPQVTTYVDTAMQLMRMPFVSYSAEAGIVAISYSKNGPLSTTNGQEVASERIRADWQHLASGVATDTISNAVCALLLFVGVAFGLLMLLGSTTGTLCIMLILVGVVLASNTHRVLVDGAGRLYKWGVGSVEADIQAAVIRASVEIPAGPSTSAAWRSAASWAAAIPTAGELCACSVRQRGITRRGSLGVLVEGCPGAPAGTPLLAFVLQPRVNGDDGGRLCGLVVHAYFAPAVSTSVAKAAAGISTELESLLGVPLAMLKQPESEVHHNCVIG